MLDLLVEFDISLRSLMNPLMSISCIGLISFYKANWYV